MTTINDILISFFTAVSNSLDRDKYGHLIKPKKYQEAWCRQGGGSGPSGFKEETDEEIIIVASQALQGEKDGDICF